MKGDLPAEEVIRLLGLQPHPEGGFFRETFRDGATDAAGRSRSTAIYYLLRDGEVSVWHRVTNAAEVFHYYAGAPLELIIEGEGGKPETHILGPDLAAGERPQFMVPAGVWQTSRPVPGRGWSLIGCTVAPAFELASFEMRT